MLVPVFPHPALLFLLLCLLLFETAHTGVACGAGETGDAFWGVLAINQQLWIIEEKQHSSMIKDVYCESKSQSTFMSHSVPLGVISGLLRASWMISWASVFLALSTSMVSFSCVNSESWKRRTMMVHVIWQARTKIFFWKGIVEYLLTFIYKALLSHASCYKANLWLVPYFQHNHAIDAIQYSRNSLPLSQTWEWF